MIGHALTGDLQQGSTYCVFPVFTSSRGMSLQTYLLQSLFRDGNTPELDYNHEKVFMIMRNLNIHWYKLS